MAGLFGLFNYEKEGRGVRKDGPKKRAFVVFFEIFFRNIWRFVLINFVYIAACVPIITHGCAHAGLTNITRNIARDKHSFGLSDFFETIRKNLKQSLAVGVINTLITLLIGFSIYFYYASYAETGSYLSLLGLAVSLSVAIVFAIMNFYIYTLMITFDFKLKQLYINSFKFVFANLKNNLLCGALLLLVYGIFVAVFMFMPNPRVLFIELLIAAILLPSFRFLMVQFFTFPSIKKYIIDPYYAAHPDADIDKRRGLGLDTEPDADEPDFSDTTPNSETE